MSATNKSGHVLVVEDDRDIRESVVEVLQDAGYTVSAAADGREALKLIAAASPLPDLVLLDLMMPVMNGFQFRQEQLKCEELAAIPVLVVTADANARVKAESLGVAGFIQKPLKIQPLLDQIERLVGKA
jgi:two-component system, chemotaxis family, chemotaxis protein CheY